MIEPIEDMPPGTIGFAVSGEVGREDFRDVLMPALRQAVDSGEALRLFVHVTPDFAANPTGRLLEDAKAEMDLGLIARGKWKRVAVVTEVPWVQKFFNRWGWMAPAEVRCVGLGELEEAKLWTAG